MKGNNVRKILPNRHRESSRQARYIVRVISGEARRGRTGSIGLDGSCRGIEQEI